MKNKRLDRITIAEFCGSPIDLYIAIPLSVPKNKVLEKAKEFLRKINIETKQEKGYLRIVTPLIEKTYFDNSELLSHPYMRWNYFDELTNYHCWAIKIEFLHKGESISRRKVLKYHRGKNRNFRNFHKKKINIDINKMFKQIFEEEGE